MDDEIALQFSISTDNISHPTRLQCMINACAKKGTMWNSSSRWSSLVQSTLSVDWWESHRLYILLVCTILRRAHEQFKNTTEFYCILKQCSFPYKKWLQFSNIRYSTFTYLSDGDIFQPIFCRLHNHRAADEYTAEIKMIYNTIVCIRFYGSITNRNQWTPTRFSTSYI